MAAPWLPLYSSVLDTTEAVTNNRTSLTYPRFVITGPGFYPRLENVTQGTFFALDYRLLHGESVTLDFSPTRRSAISSIYGTLAEAIAAGSTYWSLAAGDNTIRILLGGTNHQAQVVMYGVPTG